MLYIRYDKPINQHTTKYSAYISFQYNPFYVEEIKKIPTRYWLPEKKEWEIPTTYINDIKKIDDVYELNELPEIDTSVLRPFNFKTQPEPHQIEGMLYMLNHESWLLGDGMGLGKTKQVIDLACYLKQYEGLKHCLVICGVNNLKYNFAEEIKKHSNESFCILGDKYRKGKAEISTKNKIDHLKDCPEEFFWITNIETMRLIKEGAGKSVRYNSPILIELNNYIKDGTLGLVVVDEIHMIKNPVSLQGRGVLKLKDTRKGGMSGTLLVNRPLDLYSPLSFVGALYQNYWQFQEEFTVKDIFGSIVGYKNTSKLQKVLDMYMLRRKKDILDLPPKIHSEVIIEMSKEERKLYDDILAFTKGECDKISNPVAVLAQLIRLRQVCCHTGLVSTQIVKSSKFDWLRENIQEFIDNGDKVIVYSMFRELAELGVGEFQEYNPLHIWGQMNQAELQHQIDQFQNGEGFQMLFGVIQAAGTGITLNEATKVIFLDLPWNRATMEQAEDRAHRIGTKKTVEVISLLMKDSYDEYLHKIIIRKGEMSDALVDGKDSRLYSYFLRCLFKEEEYND